MKLNRIMIALGAIVIIAHSPAQNSNVDSTIEFFKLNESGILSQELSDAIPIHGCLTTYDLVFPEFKKGIINKSDIFSWVDGYATMGTSFIDFKKFENTRYDTISTSYFANAFQLGYYLLMELKDGRYLAVLPLVSDNVMSHISVSHGKPKLKVCTYGTAIFNGKAPLFSYAFAADPYSATQKCWELAVDSEFCKNNVQLRSKKAYPEVFQYLGWCTWEAYEGNISEDIVSKTIKHINESSVPIRWIIVDDGYLDEKVPHEGAKRQLLSFGVNKKFPNGWKPITSLKEEDGIKWMGIWRNMSGGMGGVSPEHTMTEIKDNLMGKTVHRINKPSMETVTEYSMIIKPDMVSSEKFYTQMANNTIEGKFDLMKVDFQTYNFWMYSGTGNAVNSAHQNNQALESVCKANNMPLLNCISQSSVNVFNTKYSIISRASVDIKLDNDNMARTVQAFANNMWWGEVLIGDLDMYHTSNEKTAEYLTIARAVSGGPVYISDKPEHFNKKLIEKLVFKDGKVIRALAPAVPLKESLFNNMGADCYRVIAPTRHRSCAIAVFNFSEQSYKQSYISKNDYTFAAAKEQPYTGLWEVPEEGLVVYDWQDNTGAWLDADYKFGVERMKGKIFNIAPVKAGWAVIGRSDKYLGGCTYHIDNCSEKMLELELDESGPVVVFCKEGNPKTNAGVLLSLGNGFYEIDMPIGVLNKKIKLEK